MKKLILINLIFILCLWYTFAHPLDISSTYITISWNKAQANSLFHSYQMEYLLWKNQIQTWDVNEYFKNKNIIIDYVKNHINLYNQNKKCNISEITVNPQEEYQIIDRWFEVNYTFLCEEKISEWNIEIIFFKDFELQTNNLTIYDANNWIMNSTQYKSITLNNNYNKFDFNINLKLKKEIDTDWDWLSNIEENHYKTNPNNIDTDWDKYSDYEEITTSYNPLNSSLWPSQKYREKLEITNFKEETKQTIQKDDNSRTIFSQVLEKISNYVKNINNENIIYIFLLIVCLWFIHAMWPGHSKSVLVWYVRDKNKNLLDATIYALIFTITHLIDIVIIFIIAKVFFSYYDMSNYIVYIQRISIIILIFLSLYIIYTSYKNLKQKQNISCKKDTKSKYFMWFLLWLAPCTFGWSIFLLLFSLWSIDLIPIFIRALWIWIFICLMAVVIMTYFLREKVFSKIKFFTTYSSIISWIIILISWLYILLTLF